MIHQGKILKQQIKLSGKKVEAIADAVGVVRQTIYDWYKEEKLDNDKIDRLKKVGINITEDTRQLSGEKKQEMHQVSAHPIIESLKMQIEGFYMLNKMLVQKQEEMQAEIKKLKSECDTLKESLSKLTKVK